MTGEPATSGASERDFFAFRADTPTAGEVVPAPKPKARRPAFRLNTYRALAARLARETGAAATLERERGAAALFAPLALGAGALFYFILPIEPAWPPVLAVVLALLILSFTARRHPYLQLIAPACLLIGLGVACAKLETARAGTKVLGGEISTRLTGYVVDIDHRANGRVRLTVDVTKTERPALRYQPDRVRVSAGKVPSELEIGSLVSGPVRLQPPPGPLWPGAYDFSFESYFDGIGANGFFLGHPQLVESSAEPTLSRRLAAMVGNIRSGIAERVRARIGAAEGEIAAALLVGVRAGIPEDVNEALRRTGLAHILSISGLHMALVAAAVMASLRWCLALFPGLASTRPIKKYAAAAALATITAYLFISGAEVAAQRSFIMLAVMLAAVLVDRQALTMRNLAISAIIILAISPHEIVGPSFQMSFAATAALIGAYAAWSAYKQRRPVDTHHLHEPLWRSMARKFASLLAGAAITALIAGFATGIFGAWHFQRISPLSLVANLAVTPVVSLVIMPFGLMAMLAMPFGFDGPLLTVMGSGLSMLIAIANWLSVRSPLDAVGSVPAMSVVWFTVALLAATLSTTKLRWLALPLTVFGLITLAGRQPPDVLVSEDARLVAINGPDGKILVNRARPNAFTVEGWQRLFGGGEAVKPVSLVGPSSSDDASRGKTGVRSRASKRSTRTSQESPARSSIPVEQVVAAATGGAFVCSETVCAARNGEGRLVVTASNGSEAKELCASAALIVLQDAAAADPCRLGQALVISARMLARFGAAQVDLAANETAAAPEGAGKAGSSVGEINTELVDSNPDGAREDIHPAPSETDSMPAQMDSGLEPDQTRSRQPAAAVPRFSISEPYRPWHAHRAFSREARGLPPYRSESRRNDENQATERK